MSQLSGHARAVLNDGIESLRKKTVANVSRAVGNVPPQRELMQVDEEDVGAMLNNLQWIAAIKKTEISAQPEFLELVSKKLTPA